MMIFSEEEVSKIKKGKKTLTIRATKRATEGIAQFIVIGRDFKNKFGRITPIKIYSKKLEDMTEEEAVKDGFTNRVECLDYHVYELHRDIKDELIFIEFKYNNE